MIGPDKRPGRLFATVAAQPEAGRIAFELTARPGRTARPVTLSVRYCQVTLRQPRRGAAKRDPRQITLDIVGTLLEKVVDLLLAFVLFQVVHREATRYRTTSPDLPPSLRL